MKAVITNRASLIVDTEKGACDAADDLFSLRLAAVMVPVVTISNNDQAFDIFFSMYKGSPRPSVRPTHLF